MPPWRCILSKFYIKPQQRVRHKVGHSVVSYRNSTSNHNSVDSTNVCAIVVSYRNSTSNHNSQVVPSNSLYVVSYRNSTSNHNYVEHSSCLLLLYLIEILHQTTTPAMVTQSPLLLYLIEILHQTTTYLAI